MGSDRLRANDFRHVGDDRGADHRATGATNKLIGFCTVQENTALSADFRIAKSYGGTPQNAFVQGGNAFGTTALLGTTDSQPLNISVNGQRVMRYEPNAESPNLIGGIQATAPSSPRRLPVAALQGPIAWIDRLARSRALAPT